MVLVSARPLFPVADLMVIVGNWGKVWVGPDIDDNWLAIPHAGCIRTKPANNKPIEDNPLVNAAIHPGSDSVGAVDYPSVMAGRTPGAGCTTSTGRR